MRKRFNAVAYDLHTNGLYKQKVIPDKKKQKNKKKARKKIDIRNYQSFFV